MASARATIVSRSPTTLYQLRKFAKRNKTLVAGVAGVVLALAAGTVVSSLLAVRSDRLAELAERRAYRASITVISSISCG